MSELELTINGTALDAATSDYTRALYGAPVFTPPTAAGSEVEYPGWGTALTGAMVPQPMQWSFMVEMTSLDSVPLTGQRRQLGLVEDLAKLCDPQLGEVHALFTRKDTTGADVERYLRTQFLARPIFAYSPRGGGEGVRVAPRSRYTVQCVSRFPFFIANAPSYDQEITNLSNTYDIPNPGSCWTGFRLKVNTGTTYDGDTITITDKDDATNTIAIYFPNGLDGTVGGILEWWYPAAILGDPLGVRSFYSTSRGVMIPTPGGWLDLPAGATTTLNFAVSGGSGTTKLQFTVTPIYFSL
jgi:hypothetical protein